MRSLLRIMIGPQLIGQQYGAFGVYTVCHIMRYRFQTPKRVSFWRNAVNGAPNRNEPRFVRYGEPNSPAYARWRVLSEAWWGLGGRKMAKNCPKTAQNSKNGAETTNFTNFANGDKNPRPSVCIRGWFSAAVRSPAFRLGS